MKIIFFIDSIHSGGKERRMLELIDYLRNQNDYELMLVVTDENVYFKYTYDFEIPIIVLKRNYHKYDPTLFCKFYKICNTFKPDVIHAWGKMTTFYALPSKFIKNIPLVSNLIADSDKRIKRWSLDSLFYFIDIHFSNIVLSNSKAGLLAYNIKTPKARVIHNGVNLKRFNKKFDIKKIRETLGIKTFYVVTMVASFSDYKDYDLFIDVAKELGKYRDDVTFIGVGDGPNWKRIQQRAKDENLNNVLLTGNRTNVESIIAASDIGLLCSFSEGISNSIIECMALGKPVITTDLIGGSKEIIIDGETGYFSDRNPFIIIELINLILKNSELNNYLGQNGKERITSHFSIARMGKDFEIVYKEVLSKKK